MTYKGKWPGTWATICDVCGFRFPSDKLQDRWDGLKVCHKDWELRHPQDFIKVREEVVVPPWTRPEKYTFTYVCTQITIQGQADIGVADCAQADRHTIDNFMQYCPIIPTSVAGLAIAGCMVAGTST